MAWLLSILGLSIGAGLGFAALVNPPWAAKLVRLREAAPGGASEFRATYGGLFFGAHAAALALAFLQMGGGGLALSTLAVGAVAVLSAAWFGSAGGRILSFLLDGTATKFMQASALFEIVVGALIAAPWILWLLEASYA